MLDVFLTFDVELWCDGWEDLDAKFPGAFERYIYGRSAKGQYGLPATLDILARHGLRATFFVEPLFACRFGLEPLREIVGLIREAGQDVQLHLHPEWTDEARPPLLGATEKRQHLFHYSRQEQEELIAVGRDMLVRAGADRPCAFRAGNYACDRNTLKALAKAGIDYDSSVNPARNWSGADLDAEERGQRVRQTEGVWEYPISVYRDLPGRLRQVQVGSTSFGEMVALLQQAESQGRRAFVIVSHNFEMLLPERADPDDIVVRRFRRLCAFLDSNRSRYRTVAFGDRPQGTDVEEPAVLNSPVWHVAWRMAEQARRRLAA